MSETDETRPRSQRPPRRRHRLRKILLGLFACLLSLVLVVAGTGFYLQHKLSSQIARIDGVFAGLKQRPSKPANGDASKVVNILLISARPSETLMVVHIDSDRRGTSVISIPRDSWVNVPGLGDNRINAAISLAKPSLAVQTVENLTNLRIDHLAVIDWKAFRELTDALGGLVLDIPRTVHDPARGITWATGRQTLSGEEALDYSDQHLGLPGGELDRIRRQQYFLRELMDNTLHQEFRKEPLHVYKVINTVANNLSVDSRWSTGEMRDLAISLRNLRSADIRYMTVPTQDTGLTGQPGLVFLDERGNKELWAAVREDRVADWQEAHPDSGVPDDVN